MTKKKIPGALAKAQYDEQKRLKRTPLALQKPAPKRRLTMPEASRDRTLRGKKRIAARRAEY